jgi:alpha-glucosidase (family GH31 glycosyl hydrolase)
VEADLATLPLWLRDGAAIPLGPAMDYVDQRPLDALTLRIAPFREEGSRELRIPTTDDDLVVRYAYAEGRHRVDAPPGLEVVLDVVGRHAPAIDLR